MFKPLLAIVVLASAAVLSAEAKTHKIPSDEFPIVSLTLPDNWDAEEVTNGIAGTSADGAIYLSAVAVGNDKGMSAELEDTFAMLKEHDVDLDKDSKKENKFKINGLEAEEMVFQGKDEDGPAAVSITFVTVKDKIIVLTYWVSTEDEKKHDAEVSKIVNSLKPAS